MFQKLHFHTGQYNTFCQFLEITVNLPLFGLILSNFKVQNSAKNNDNENFIAFTWLLVSNAIN